MPLDGQVLSGEIYVFVSPDAGVDRVTFFLDGESVRNVRSSPFDFLGTTSQNTAAPFNTNQIETGEHVIEAVIDRVSGPSVSVESVFNVKN